MCSERNELTVFFKCIYLSAENMQWFPCLISNAVILKSRKAIQVMHGRIYIGKCALCQCWGQQSVFHNLLHDDGLFKVRHHMTVHYTLECFLFSYKGHGRKVTDAIFDFRRNI